MAGFFLTTPALEISLLWPTSRLGKFILNAPTTERWVSPLSHAILTDVLHTRSIDIPVRRRGLRAVTQHQREMKLREPQYPLPNMDAINKWADMRGLAVDIPAYQDSVASHPAQAVGPDEMLVYATAAVLSKQLLGPAPTDPTMIEYLADLGVTFFDLNGIP